MSRKDRSLTKGQVKIISEYCEKYGGVTIKETDILVQLLLNGNMVKMEGITMYWLSQFSKFFYNVSIGIPDYPCEECAAYITLFKNHPDESGYLYNIDISSQDLELLKEVDRIKHLIHITKYEYGYNEQADAIWKIYQEKIKDPIIKKIIEKTKYPIPLKTKDQFFRTIGYANEEKDSKFINLPDLKE